jgi:hypothetical protein
MGSYARTDDFQTERVFFGARLVSAGLISESQREQVSIVQTKLKLNGKWQRFGDIAVDQGFCSANDVESLTGFLGQKLIEAGILTPTQQQSLAKWQTRLRNKGYNVRYGELMVSEGLCSQTQIDELLELPA